jgi:hypothetical protein
MISRPAPATSVSARVRTVSTNCGITAGQAAEFGLTESTPTIAHSGRSRIHSNAGAMIAIARGDPGERPGVARRAVPDLGDEVGERHDHERQAV